MNFTSFENESRKRKRDSTYPEFETSQRYQQIQHDPNSSLFLTDSDDDDRNTANNEEVMNSRSSNTPSRRPTYCHTPREIRTRKSNKVNGTSNSSTTSTAALSRGANIIKEERIEERCWTGFTKSPNQVTIYVGKHNAQLSAKREDLAKSPVLSSWITEDAQQGSYIMRPQLLRLDLNDFDAVLQYIHSGEYAPLLMENVHDPNGPKLLDGLKPPKDYARELVRSGRIYVIAQDFQVSGMTDQIFRKITEVDTTKFNNQALVELAGVIFKNDRSSSAQAPAEETTDEQHTESSPPEGRLEKWIIAQLAKNFREIMRMAQALFWRVERETSRTCMFAQVLEEVARQYREIGGLPVADFIELE